MAPLAALPYRCQPVGSCLGGWWLPLGRGGWQFHPADNALSMQCFEHCPLQVWGRESYFGSADVGTAVQFHSPRVASPHRCPSLSYDERQIMGKSVRPALTQGTQHPCILEGPLPLRKPFYAASMPSGTDDGSAAGHFSNLVFFSSLFCRKNY